MSRFVVFGNSGSGKSTLARKLCEARNLSHLDLDTLAWQAGKPPRRKPIDEAAEGIRAFTAEHNAWVIEGCYSDLIEVVLPEATDVVYMNLSVAACIENAKNRPWEPHKYASKAEQDANLTMLVDWISEYSERVDSFSKSSHKALFETFSGRKTEVSNNISDWTFLERVG